MIEIPASASTPDVSWVWPRLDRMPAVHYVVLASQDGLLRGRSERIDRDIGDTVAAGVSGLYAASRGLLPVMGIGTQIRQVMVETDGGHLFVCTAKDQSRLAVVTGLDIDPGNLAYEMHEVCGQLSAEPHAVGDRPPEAPDASRV